MKVLLGATQLAKRSDVTEEHGRRDLRDNLESDFKKGDSPAEWAPGHPVAWGHEQWKFSSGEEKSVTSVSATSDEKYFAIAIDDTLVIFEVDGYKLASVLKTGDGPIKSIEFARKPSEDTYVLACQYGDQYGRATNVKIWLLDQDCREIDPDKKIVVEGYLPTFAPSVFSSDCKTLLLLATTTDEWGSHLAIVALDVQTGKEKFRMTGHTDSIMWTGFSPDDKFIASAAWDRYMKLWSGEDGKFIRDYGPTGAQNWACAFDPEGVNLAVTTGAHRALMWRIDDPQSFPIALAGKVGWERVISNSPDGTKLAIGSADGRLMVHETKAMTLIQVWQLGAEIGGSRWLKEVTEIKWLDNGNRISWTPSDGSLQMYDFETNMKWKWAAGKEDKWRRGAWFNTVVLLERKGLIGSRDQDGAFRMWKIPEK